MTSSSAQASVSDLLDNANWRKIDAQGAAAIEQALESALSERAEAFLLLDSSLTNRAQIERYLGLSVNSVIPGTGGTIVTARLTLKELLRISTLRKVKNTELSRLMHPEDTATEDGFARE